MASADRTRSEVASGFRSEVLVLRSSVHGVCGEGFRGPCVAHIAQIDPSQLIEYSAERPENAFEILIPFRELLKLTSTLSKAPNALSKSAERTWVLRLATKPPEENPPA